MKKDVSLALARLNLVLMAVSVATGTACAIFLTVLNLVTSTRFNYPFLIWGLPVAGLAMGWVYDRYGRAVESGNNLILDEIHRPKDFIPFRILPLILISTWVTHLFGGSAGREGTAVQMGGSIADQFAKTFKLQGQDRQTLLIAGMSAGFGAVFGVPLAGALFGIEVLAVGSLKFRALVACIIASFVANFACRAWGIRHAITAAPVLPHASVVVISSVVLAGLLFGLCARAFSELMHKTFRFYKRVIKHPALRTFVGAAIVVAGYELLGTLRYAGLGDDVIAQALSGKVPRVDFLWKGVFTALTLGSGMKGGEVTPLFFIGSTFGNALSALLPLPITLLSTLGFVAVFAGAANTPLTCTLMAIELFGTRTGPYALIACYASYFASGHHGLYTSQKIARPKLSHYLRAKLKP